MSGIWVEMPELVTYPNDKVAFICGPQMKVGAHPSFDSIAISKGIELALSVPTEADDFNSYLRANYYDLAFCQYLNYYRTGDIHFLTIARETADAFWKSRWINHGTVTQGDNNLSPRSMAYAGLMLRALDGRPEMWDYLERQTRTAFDAWLLAKITHVGPKLPSWMDMRELGYAQLYAVLLAKVLPDSYSRYANGTQQPSTGTVTDGAARRAQFFADAENVAVNFFGRLQLPDGSWRNDVPSEDVVNCEQPFMTGIYHEAVSRLYELTTKDAVKASLKTQLTKSLDQLFTHGYDNRQVSNLPQYRWRAFDYYDRGGTTAEPTKFESHVRTESCGPSDCGDTSITAARLQNSTVIHAFSFAYKLTGDPKYRAQGQELFGACFGDEIDNIKSLAGTAGGKEYCMFMRSAGQFLAHTATSPVQPPVVVTPAPPRKASWPKQVSKHRAILDAQWNQGYRLQDDNLDGDWAMFEKVK